MPASRRVDLWTTDPRAILPAYQTAGAAGFDFTLIEDDTLYPLEPKPLRTGLIMHVPPAHVLLVAPRSSAALKRRITIVNTPGVIDADYCGPRDEIMLLALNYGPAPVAVRAGERLAQGLLLPVTRADFIAHDGRPSAPSRGGLGSTGR